jgi:peptidoglycan/xylan/chitin deacetylase (PgdA/CDA1 family)
MALGYKIVMWDVLSFDWDKTVSNQECLNHVISKSKNGSIIVFHDSVKASNNMKFTLPKVLEYYTEKGFSFKAIAL